MQNKVLDRRNCPAVRNGGQSSVLGRSGEKSYCGVHGTVRVAFGSRCSPPDPSSAVRGGDGSIFGRQPPELPGSHLSSCGGGGCCRGSRPPPGSPGYGGKDECSDCRTRPNSRDLFTTPERHPLTPGGARPRGVRAQKLPGGGRPSPSGVLPPFGFRGGSSFGLHCQVCGLGATFRAIKHTPSGLRRWRGEERAGVSRDVACREASRGTDRLRRAAFCR